MTIPDFLKTALDALPDAAKSPLAFVGYLAAVGCWAAIAWRVRRNKQLLKNLDKLPERDRLKALELEMGSLPLAPGLTPDQWLRARIQRYYFLAFMIVCLVAVIVFAIASFDAKQPDPFGPQKDGIGQLDVGLSRDVVVSKLGVPYSEVRFKGCSCADYKFPFAYVQLLYNKTDELIYYLVVSKSKDFHPTVPLPYQLQKPACLGCLSFSDMTLKGETPYPIYFNMSSKLYTYTEGTPDFGLASRGRSTYLSFLGVGEDYGSEIPDSEIPESDILERMTHSASAFAQASGKEKQEFEKFRSATKPNAFAVFTEDLWGGAAKFGVPTYLNLPRGGGDFTCKGELFYRGF